MDGDRVTRRIVNGYLTGDAHVRLARLESRREQMRRELDKMDAAIRQLALCPHGANLGLGGQCTNCAEESRS